jgi:hypothetical protein
MMVSTTNESRDREQAEGRREAALREAAMRSLFAVASRRSSPPAPSVGVIDPVGSSLIAGLPPAREAAVMRSIKFEFTAKTRALSAGFLGRASRL